MKKIIRHYVYATFALFAVSNIAKGISFEEGIKTLLIAGGCVAITSVLAKPAINLLLLPLNLVTFGLFRWLSSGIILFVTTRIIPSFKVSNFYIAGFTTNWFEFPTIDLKLPFAYIGFSFLYSFIASFTYWLRK